MDENKGLKDEFKELKQILLKDKEEIPKEKKKRFRLPYKSKVGKAKVKKNWVTVVQLYENRNAKFTRFRIEDQTIMMDGIPRIATADNVFLIEGKQKKPMIIQPMWSVKPTSPSDEQFLSISKNYKEIEDKGLNVKGYKVLLNRMKLEAISTKKPLPWWIWIVGLGILGVVVYLLMFQK